MTDKKAIQITEENIEQLNIKTGSVLKDNEGTFWKITKFDDFMASMTVCDKSGNEIKDFTGNAVRSVYGGGLAGLLNDNVSTYFIETEQPEITNEPLKHVFKKEMQRLEGISKKEQEKFEEYQKALKMAYADGVVSFAERNKLFALKNELGLSDRDCKNMEYAYRLISEKADSMDKSTEQLHADNGINDAAGKTISDRTLSVSNYGVYFFAGGKEVSFLGFEYTAAGEEAVLDMLGIRELRNGRGLKLEYRLDGEGKEQFLASDRPENIFDAQVFVDGDYRSEKHGRNRTFPEKIKDDMCRAAEKYTRENFGKSVREQIQAENEMNAVLTAIEAYCDDGIVPNDGRFILPPTPEYLRRIGSDETEITLPVSVVKKAMERHHLTRDEIKSAVCGLYDPVLAFDSDKSRTENKADSRLILTDEFKDGKPIALAVNVNSTIRVSNGKKSLEVQNIRTIHDRTLTAKNGTDLIQKWTEDGLCRYVDDKKITGWSNVARVYFPIDELQSADNRIVRKSDIVNRRNAVQEQLQKSNSELTAEDLKNASVLLPKEQYQLVLSYIQGEEGEHFKGIIKEISSKAEEIKGKTEILTEDEKHPLAFKYTLGNSSFYFSEWDGKDEFFGYAILNGDTQMSEWGYTSLEELKNAGGKDRNGFPVMPEMAFYRLEDTIEKQISVDYPELSEKMGFEPEKSHNEELISKFGKQIFETLQSRRLEQSAYNICCAAQFVLRTMDFSERKEVFAIMEKCGCKGKNGKEETVDFLTEIVKAENNTISSVYDRKRLYWKINKSCEPKSHGQKNKNQRFVGDYDIEV